MPKPGRTARLTTGAKGLPGRPTAGRRRWVKHAIRISEHPPWVRVQCRGCGWSASCATRDEANQEGRAHKESTSKLHRGKRSTPTKGRTHRRTRGKSRFRTDRPGSPPPARPRHAAVRELLSGPRGFRSECSCGWTGSWFTSETNARVAIQEHVRDPDKPQPPLRHHGRTISSKRPPNRPTGNHQA